MYKFQRRVLYVYGRFLNAIVLFRILRQVILYQHIKSPANWNILKVSLHILKQRIEPIYTNYSGRYVIYLDENCLDFKES